MNCQLRAIPFLLCLSFFACSEQATTTEEDLLVVKGYLYAGEPVADILLSDTMPIGSDEDGPPITDAAVSLSRNGVVYALAHDSLNLGYYRYPGSDLVPAAGDVFSLEIARGGSYMMASTIVPLAPVSVTANQETLTVTLETFEAPFGTVTRVISDDTLAVSWSGTSGDLYYTIIQNVESNPSLLMPEEDTLFSFRQISRPVARLQYQVQVPTLRYAGRHRVKVYHVNQEYADLYRSREQDSRNLNEPLTNIKGGLGVFSAFASDSVDFYVKLE